MASVKSNRKEILYNRRVIALIGLIVVFAFAIITAMWFGITVQDFALMTYEVPYTNSSNVYLSEVNMEILNTRYESDSLEFIYCLYGDVNEDGYYIEELKSTDVISASDDVISYVPCSRTKHYLGTIHSHPQPENPRYYSTCDLSDQDLFTFGAEGETLTGVICGRDKLAIYGVESFSESLNIVVVE